MKRESIPLAERSPPASPERREGRTWERRSPRVTPIPEDHDEDEGGDGGGRRRLWLWLGAAALLLLAVLGLLWWLGVWPFGGADEEEGQSGRGNQPVPVSVATVRPEEIPVYYEYNGLTFASRQADIRPRISGAIEEIAFEEGADVVEGQLLYQLDARPFEAALAQAEAERGSVEASLAFAEAQVARFSELAEEGFATGERYDQALARREELQGQLAAIQARIESARLNRQYSEVRAPFSGRAGLSPFNEGEIASPGGEALTSVVQLDPIEVRFELRGDELPRIRLAMAGEEPVRVVALLGEDAAYAEYGRLTALDNSIDPRTGTMTAQALFPNPNELLVPGRFVDARLLLGRAEAVLIPTAALSALQDRRIVYRVGPEGEAVATPVEIGRRFEDRVVVVSGLRPGDRIVTSNLQSVRAGVPLAVPSPEPPAEPTPPGAEPRASAAATRGEEVARPAPLGPATDDAPGRPQGADLVVAPGGEVGAGAPGEGPPLVGSRPAGAGVPGDALRAGPTGTIPPLGADVGTGYDVPSIAPAQPTPPEPVPPAAPPSPG